MIPILIANQWEHVLVSFSFLKFTEITGRSVKELPATVLLKIFSLFFSGDFPGLSLAAIKTESVYIIVKLEDALFSRFFLCLADLPPSNTSCIVGVFLLESWLHVLTIKIVKIWKRISCPHQRLSPQGHFGNKMLTVLPFQIQSTSYRSLRFHQYQWILHRHFYPLYVQK